MLHRPEPTRRPNTKMVLMPKVSHLKKKNHINMFFTSPKSSSEHFPLNLL